MSDFHDKKYSVPKDLLFTKETPVLWSVKEVIEAKILWGEVLREREREDNEGLGRY